MKTLLTLILITKGEEILLGLKKRGFGMGKINGFGGKVEAGETIEEAAIREVFEECSLEIKSMEHIATTNFSWQNKNQDIEIYVFHTKDFTGKPQESEEMKPAWYNINDVPYKKMWDDSRYWFPLFLKGEKFKAQFILDKHDKVVSHNIDIIAP